MDRVLDWNAVESSGSAMKLYHRTSRAAAEAILRTGFTETTTTVGGINVTGVWLSNYPVDVSEGAKGNVLLRVVVRADLDDLARWEVVNEGGTYREWCIPAPLLRERATVAKIEDDDPELPEVRFPEAWAE